ncbi:MAG: peptidoglycan-binding protein, partial [Defluviitaleaceae bacterium]|nr:peptidoglycan-binding protein [Defluviitaleaceae bacterium]
MTTQGRLLLQVVAAGGDILIDNATITLTDQRDNVVYQLHTDRTGHAPEVILETPCVTTTYDPYAKEKRYARYNARVEAKGYNPVLYKGIMVIGDNTAIQVIEMHPLVENESPILEIMDVSGHALDGPVYPEDVNFDDPENPFLRPDVWKPRDVAIPNYITVHLGRPEVWAPNVRVPFIDYIKNVTSHEIFDSWPEETITANVWCIISLTLNRIFTEFYRSRNLNFDITSATSIDQMYVHHGTIGARISAIVDGIFNQYLAQIGHLEPFLALYNDGTTANIPGRLSQWGSFFDARDRGMNAWQIIEKYYRPALELRESNNFKGPLESWPGHSLSEGSSGLAVETMQRYLNRVLGRYTDIIINPVDGVFGASTRNSVRVFQQIYNLPQTGVIDRATWYQISRIYAIEKALWEMNSEGIRIGIGRTPPTTVIRQGATGRLVTELQFLLDYIGLFYDSIPFVADTSRFDGLTTESVREFQRIFGLNVDGVVGPITWRKLYDVYWGIKENTPEPQPAPPPVNPPNMPPYPGSLIRLGSTGESARLIQGALNRLSEAIPTIGKVPEDGVFGESTREAVMAFQRTFGLTIDGIVGPITWDRLFREYLDLQPEGPSYPYPYPPFPGSNIQMGASGQSVRDIQEAINRLAACENRLWILNVDGNFGIATRDAIFTFQSDYGLPITGVVDRATWDRLMEEAAACSGVTPPPPQPPITPPFPGTSIRPGDSGQNVRTIQEAINQLAKCQNRLWILTVDGVFGNQTRDAIFTFQNVYGLPITGVVDRTTWDRLMQEAASCSGGGVTPPDPNLPPYPGSPIQMGSTGQNVRAVQEAINKLSRCENRLWILTVDGNFGAATRDAIFTFQSDYGLPITGVVDQTTWDRLMQEADACGGGGTT